MPEAIELILNQERGGRRLFRIEILDTLRDFNGRDAKRAQFAIAGLRPHGATETGPMLFEHAAQLVVVRKRISGEVVHHARPLAAHVGLGGAVVHVLLGQQDAVANRGKLAGTLERLLAQGLVFRAHGSQQTDGLDGSYSEEKQHAAEARDQHGSQSRQRFAGVAPHHLASV